MKKGLTFIGISCILGVVVFLACQLQILDAPSAPDEDVKSAVQRHTGIVEATVINRLEIQAQLSQIQNPTAIDVFGILKEIEDVEVDIKAFCDTCITFGEEICKYINIEVNVAKGDKDYETRIKEAIEAVEDEEEREKLRVLAYAIIETFVGFSISL